MSELGVLGYCRTSTSDQDLSLEKQEEAIKEYCKEQGYELRDIYSIQVSGRKSLLRKEHTFDQFGEVNLQERTKLRKAFYDIVNHGGIAEEGEPEPDKLIVLNPSRLARRSHYQGLLEEVAELYGFEIEYVEASEKWILRKIQSIWDEYEVRQTIKRTKKALEQKADDEWKGRPPTGYEIDEESGKLVEAAYHQELMEAVDWYRDSDRGYRSIASEFGEDVTASRIRTVVNRSEEERENIRRCLKGE